MLADGTSVRQDEGFTTDGRCFLGRWARLDPLSVDHADALFQALDGPERARVVRFMADAPPAEPAAFRACVSARASHPARRYFVCCDRETGAVGGWLSLMRDEPAHRVIEIGDVMYAPVMQRTRVGADAVYLLARHVFETLGYRRLEWKCDDLNEASRNAAMRYGFSFEGVFRQHMLVRGRSRDSAWFSMLDHEWPLRRAAFETWLAPANFDAEGRQRVALSALNGLGGA